MTSTNMLETLQMMYGTMAVSSANVIKEKEPLQEMVVNNLQLLTDLAAYPPNSKERRALLAETERLSAMLRAIGSEVIQTNMVVQQSALTAANMKRSAPASGKAGYNRAKP